MGKKDLYIILDRLTSSRVSHLNILFIELCVESSYKCRVVHTHQEEGLRLVASVIDKTMEIVNHPRAATEQDGNEIKFTVY